ncbi:MAG: helix-turn-helix domain-containing protein [Sporolactobacillus sp.]
MEGLILLSSFGEYLRHIRESKGLTLNQTAMYSGISAAQLSRIENGKRGVPKPPTIKALSEALKVKYEDLMQAAGYIDEEINNDDSIDEEIRNLMDDPDFMIAYKEMPGSPEEAKQDLIEYMKFLKDQEERKKKK